MVASRREKTNYGQKTNERHQTTVGRMYLGGGGAVRVVYYTPFTGSSKHRADIEHSKRLANIVQTSSKRRTDIQQASSKHRAGPSS